MLYTMENLGNTLTAQENLIEAEEIYLQALKAYSEPFSDRDMPTQ